MQYGIVGIAVLTEIRTLHPTPSLRDSFNMCMKVRTGMNHALLSSSPSLSTLTATSQLPFGSAMNVRRDAFRLSINRTKKYFCL